MLKVRTEVDSLGFVYKDHIFKVIVLPVEGNITSVSKNTEVGKVDDFKIP